MCFISWTLRSDSKQLHIQKIPPRHEKKGGGKDSKRIITPTTAALSTNESIWGEGGGAAWASSYSTVSLRLTNLSQRRVLRASSSLPGEYFINIYSLNLNIFIYFATDFQEACYLQP
jgi:hypothetical protein